MFRPNRSLNRLAAALALAVALVSVRAGVQMFAAPMVSFATLPDLRFNQGQSVTVAFAAIGFPSGVTYSADGLPAGLAITMGVDANGHEVGILNGTLEADTPTGGGSEGVYTVRLHASDGAVSNDFLIDVSHWNRGDVFVGGGQWVYQVYREDGSFKTDVTVPDDANSTLGYTTGCAVNWRTGEVWATNFDDVYPALNVITRHAGSNPLPFTDPSRRLSTERYGVAGAINPFAGNMNPLDLNPESVTFNNAGDMFVGHSFGFWNDEGDVSDVNGTATILHHPTDSGWIYVDAAGEPLLDGSGNVIYDTNPISPAGFFERWPGVGLPVNVLDANGFPIPVPLQGGMDLHRYTPDANGNFQQTNRQFYDLHYGRTGIDTLDMLSDQQTMNYTSEDWYIYRYDVSTSTQLPVVGSSVPGESIPISTRANYGIRVLPPGDGTGGYLVVNEYHIDRLDSDGHIIQVYDVKGDADYAADPGLGWADGDVNGWFAIAIGPEGRTFWAATRQDVFHFDLASGEVIGSKIRATVGTLHTNAELAGLCIMDEYRAAQEVCGPTGLGNNIDDDFDGTIDEGCFRVEICSALSPGDDDGDGLVDYNDPDCGAVPSQQCVVGGPTDNSVAGICDRADYEGDTVLVPGIPQPCNGAAECSEWTFSYSATGLPPGLVMNPLTGEVTGMPFFSIVNPNLSTSTPVVYPITVSSTWQKTGEPASTFSNTFNWTIYNRNRAPVAVDDGPQAVLAGGSFSFDVRQNDSDIDGDTFTIQAFTQPPVGQGTVAQVGQALVYTAPASGFGGTTTFTYKLVDSYDDTPGVSDWATVTVIVNGPPVANPDAYTTPEDTPLTINARGIMVNDSDPNGDPIHVVVGTVTQPAHGTVVANPNGDGGFLYTPDLHYSGVDTFTYQVNDGSLDSNVTTVTITITAVNHFPIAVDDTNSTLEDVPVSGVAQPNDTPSLDGGNVWTKVTNPGYGTVTMGTDGSYTYTPNAGFSGLDSFTYRLCDGDGDCVTAVIRITVVAKRLDIVATPVCIADTPYVSFTITPVNFTPVVGATATLLWKDPFGQPIQTNVLPWTNVNQPLTVQMLWPGAVVDGNGVTIDWPGWLIQNGVWVQGHDGFETTRPTSTVEISVNPTTTVSVTYPPATPSCNANAPVNRAPVAVDDFYTTAEDTPITVPSPGILVNDSDPENGPLTVVAPLITQPSHGTVTQNANGSLTYTPAPNYNGLDSYTYQVRDAAGNLSNIATVHITITPVNDVPLAVNDSYATNKNTPITATVVGNDTPSPDGGNVWSVVTGAAHGTVVMTSNGGFTYTPATGYAGQDQFTYKLCDVDNDCATAVATILINDVPAAVNDSFTTPKNTALTGSVTGNDTPSIDGGNAWTATSAPAHGTVTMTSAGGFTYTPTTGYTGTDTFNYKVCDVDNDCATATVTIKINDVPLAVNDSYTTNKNTALTGSVTGNDTSSADGGNTWTATSAPAHGTVTMTTAGNFTYTPATGYSGTDSFTYKVCDVDNDCATATVTIRINDVPLAVNDSFTTPKNTALTGSVTANDTSSADGGNTWTLVTPPTSGTVTLTPTGNFTFTPATGFTGTVTFTYQVCDVDNDCATATVTVKINDVPLAVNDSFTTTKNTALTGSVTGNDTSSADGGNTWTATSAPAHGTVTMTSAGGFTYTPTTGYTGTDTFNYKVCDVDNDCATATVTIRINDVPLAVNDSFTTPKNTALTGSVTANDTSSADGGNTWTATSAPAHGTVTMTSAGGFTYTPTTGYTGTDTFNYKVCDVDNDCATATVTIKINDVPLAVNDSYTTNKNTPLTASVATNDTPSADGGNTWTVVTPPTSGAVVLNPNGTFTFTPATGFAGTATFTYKVCDVDNDCATAVATIKINDVPVAVNDSYTMNSGSTLNASAQTNDTPSVDGGNVWTLLTQPATGTLSFQPTGNFSYTPPSGFTGTVTFNYQVCDVDNDCSTATVTIIVNGCLPGAFTTYTQGGWGSKPAGNNPGKLLADNFATVYPTGYVQIGTSSRYLRFTSSDGVKNFLPAGGTASTLNASATNPTSSSAGVFAGQVLALQLSVDFSNAGVKKPGLGGQVVKSGPLAGYTVAQVLAAANQAIAGGALPAGVSISDLNEVVDAINNNYDNGTQDQGYLKNPAGCTANAVPTAVDDTATTPVNTPVSGSLATNDTPSTDGGNVWSKVTNPSHGTATVNADGTFTYTPTTGYTGTDTFTYKVCDVDNDCSTATVTVTVTASCAAPSAGLALVRYSPTLDGRIEGNVQWMNASSMNLNSSLTVVGDLLVPGLPSIVINGTPNYGGTVDGTGSTSPSNYQIVINSGATLGHVVRRTDPVALPTVSAPPTPTATRSFTMNSAGDNPAPFSTLKNLTLNSNVGPVTVPAGTYGTFIAGSGGSFVIGTVGATTPSVYNFQTLTLNSNSALTVLGPVVVNVASLNINGPIGAADHPEWVKLRVSSSNDLNLNSANPIYGYVEIPNGTVNINSGSKLVGGLAANRLTVNSNGLLKLVGQSTCPTNQPPVAVDDSATTHMNTPVTINVLPNDSDPDGDTLSVTSVTQPGHGTTTVSSGQTVYTPATGFTGVDAYTYTISDGKGGTATATVTVTVVNAVPLAGADTFSTPANTALNGSVTGNDTSSSDGGNVWTKLTNPSHGTVTMTSAGAFTYTPTTGYAGTDSFTYKLCDVDNDCATATVTITIVMPNRPPVAVDDSATTGVGVPVTIPVIGNDSDPDGDAISVISNTPPSTGSVTRSGNVFTYTPPAGFTGVATFTYTIADGKGGTSTATVTITINPSQACYVGTSAPQISARQTWLDNGDGTVTIRTTLSKNFVDNTYGSTQIGWPGNNHQFKHLTGSDKIQIALYDPSGGKRLEFAMDYLSASSAAPSGYRSLGVTGGDGGMVTGSSADVVSVLTSMDVNFNTYGYVLTVNSPATTSAYASNATYPNWIYDVWYEVRVKKSAFGSGGFGFPRITAMHASPSKTGNNTEGLTLTTCADGPAQPPLALPDTYTTNKNTTLTVTGTGIVGNDNDPNGDDLTTVLVSSVSHGTLTLNPNGTFTYVPANNYTGVDTYTYKVKDAGGLFSNVTTVTINVLPANRPPVAVNDAYTTPKNTRLTVIAPGIKTNDNDPDGDAITAEMVTPTSHGTLTVNADGSISYMPAANYVGTDTFTYKVKDAAGVYSNVATVTITISGVVCNLEANNDSYATNKNHAITILGLGVLGNDIDPYDRGLVVYNVNGSTSKVGASTSTAHGTVKLNSDGTFTYTPADNYTGADSFTYKAKSTYNNSVSGTATVTITIASHFDGDGDDHDRHRNGHKDGDGCSHDKSMAHHYDGDGDDHDKHRGGHHDGDGCSHDRDADRHYDGDSCDHERRRNGHRSGDNCDHELASRDHYDGDGDDHDRGRYGHRDGDGCDHDQQTSHHNDGDNCDHERERNGHYDGDGCDHDRERHSHASGDGCDHDRKRNGHYDGDHCEHDEHNGDDDTDGNACVVDNGSHHHYGDGDDHHSGDDDDHDGGHHSGDKCDHDRKKNGHKDGDGCDHDRVVKHYSGDGCDHDRKRGGHKDGDKCDHDRAERDEHHDRRRRGDWNDWTDAVIVNDERR